MKRLLILVVLILTSVPSYPQRSNSYVTIIELEDTQEVSDRRIRALNRLDPNKSYVYFEHYFSSDTLHISINNKNKTKTLILTTDKSMGFAGVQTFDVSQVKKISVSKNNGPKLTINFKDSKLWTVNYVQDTLMATAIKYPRIYE